MAPRVLLFLVLLSSWQGMSVGARQGTFAPAVAATVPATVAAPVVATGAATRAVVPAKNADWDLVCVDHLELCEQSEPGVYQLSVAQDKAPLMQASQYYLTGQFSVDFKLPAGNSGGVNWAFYMMAPGDNAFDVQPANQGENHNEIDIEFYGNGTAPDVSVVFNVFAGNMHNLAKYTLPFDPSDGFHSYAMRWNPTSIVFLVDGSPIHVIRKFEGKPWPDKAMYAMASGWATPWTPLQADYTDGPIKGWFTNYKMQGCAAKAGDVQVENGPQCAGPWNGPLTAAQIATYQKLHDAHLVKDHGWDEA